jgi:hypothetical protein
MSGAEFSICICMAGLFGFFIVCIQHLDWMFHQQEPRKTPALIPVIFTPSRLTPSGRRHRRIALFCMLGICVCTAAGWLASSFVS